MAKGQLFGELSVWMGRGCAGWSGHIHTCETVCDPEKSLKWEGKGEGRRLGAGPGLAARFQSRIVRSQRMLNSNLAFQVG